MVRRFNLYFRSRFWNVFSVEILIMIVLRPSMTTSSLGVTCILAELFFAIVASYSSPGYVVDMKDEEDVENASLLNTNSGTQLQQVAMCKQCGVKRPIRSLHCTEYAVLSRVDLDAISVLCGSIITMFSLIIALDTEISTTTCSSSYSESSHVLPTLFSGPKFPRLSGCSL